MMSSKARNKEDRETKQKAKKKLKEEVHVKVEHLILHAPHRPHSRWCYSRTQG